MGAGRTELCRLIFGLDKLESGTIEVAGKSIRPGSPREAIAAGVALIPRTASATAWRCVCPSHSI